MNPLTRTRKLFDAGVAAGHHRGAQVAATLDDETVADAALGDAARGGVMLWMSAGKPVTAVAVLAQVDAGRLGLDDPVADHLAGFGQNGKGGVTIRHLLTHTGGFRAAVLDHPRTPWAEAVAAVNAARLEPRWTPGERAGYHVYTSWYTLGALLEGATGLGVVEATRRVAIDPIGMGTCFVGMTPEQHERLAGSGSLVHTMDTSTDPPIDPGHAERAWCVNPKPGANNWGTAMGLTRLYRMLLDGAEPPGTIDGTPVLTEQTARAATSRQREGLPDATFKATIDWGLGVAIDSKRYGVERVPYGFGPHASDSAFGHGGNQCAAGFADPTHGLAAAVVWDGMPGEAAHQERLHATLAALYEDLGLA